MDWTSSGADTGEMPELPVTCAPSDLEIPFTTNDLAETGFEYQQDVAAEEVPFSDFKNWIPGYTKNSRPCEYCRSKNLVCFTLVDHGESAPCNACETLFRPCSFVAAPSNRRRAGGYIDTLQPLPEDLAQETGALTSIRPLNSTGATYDDIVQDLVSRRPEQSYKRFSRVNVHILKSWLKEHAKHPYPTEAEKEALGKETGLTTAQISNWLANARRRGKSRSKPVSPGLSGTPTTTTQPWPIAARPTNLEDLTPLERWKISPPENEPAKILDIARAVESTDLDESTTSSDGTSRSHSISDYHHRNNTDSTPGSVLSTCQEPSISSFETGNSSGSYGGSSTLSHGSSRGSYSAFARKEQRRRKKTQLHAAKHAGSAGSLAQRRLYQCTFCTDTFISKYDWTRHEKSLHLTLEKWTCAPQGSIVTLADGNKQCAFCELLNPSDDHMALHNHLDCEEKDPSARVFYRKDHLKQHLRLVHDSPRLLDSMEAWKSAPSLVRSRCGFCSAQFTTWAQRSEHLAKHFRQGATMGEWKGGWGFEPEVEACVANAVPPFFIGVEAKSPIPFSATNESSKMMETVQIDGETHPRDITCFEALTMRLGKYVKDVQVQGLAVTDAMIQAYARQIIYGDANDTWNQTPADNDEWLAVFKQAHRVTDTTVPDDATHTSAAAAETCLKQMNDKLQSEHDLELMANDASLDAFTFGQIRTEHMMDPPPHPGNLSWNASSAATSGLEPDPCLYADALCPLPAGTDFDDSLLDWDLTPLKGHAIYQNTTEDLGTFNDLLFSD